MSSRSEDLVKSHLHQQMALRVASKAVQAEAIGDPKVLLDTFEHAVKSIIFPKDKIDLVKKLLNECLEAQKNGTYVRGKWPGLDPSLLIANNLYHSAIRSQKQLRGTGSLLFLSILQGYALPKNLQKKVETASKFHSKELRPRIKGDLVERALEQIEVYEKYLETLLDQAESATQALAKGTPHGEEGETATKVKAGPFTLINTGRFSAEQMKNVADLVEKAAAYAKSSGLGEVCYGDILVTNTLSSASVLAFYLVSKDEMFVRANVKANYDTVQTVLHELGHRYEHKFLKGGPKAVSSLYYLLSGQEQNRKKNLKDQYPAKGETNVIKGKTYRVVKVQTWADKIVLESEVSSGKFSVISLDGWLQSKAGTAVRDIESDPNYIGFVSNYAKSGGPGENFAEMFAYYSMGTLPVLQSEAFESTVFGSSKSAALRVAAAFRNLQGE